MRRSTLALALAALAATLPVSQAQTITFAKALDSPHYDSQRTT